MAKHRRIALKIYEWVEKGLYFHKNDKKKNFEKKNRFVDFRTLYCKFMQVAGFLIAGHQYHNNMLTIETGN